MARKNRNPAQAVPSMEQPKYELSWPNFDEFWLWARNKYALRDAVKISLQKYLESRGYMEPSKYEEGLRKFGIK
jgi:hypothetical protein